MPCKILAFIFLSLIILLACFWSVRIYYQSQNIISVSLASSCKISYLRNNNQVSITCFPNYGLLLWLFAVPFQSQRIESESADVGAVVSNIKLVLELIDERVMLLADCKRPVTQILNTLLSEKGTDSSLLLCVLDMLKRWAEDDFGKKGSSGSSGAFLTQKDIVSFLQKLSQVDKQHFSSVALDEWDKVYLQLLYGLCADSTK